MSIPDNWLKLRHSYHEFMASRDARVPQNVPCNSFMWTPHVFIVDYETLPRPASLRGAMSRDGHLFSISQRRPKIYANA